MLKQHYRLAWMAVNFRWRPRQDFPGLFETTPGRIAFQSKPRRGTMPVRSRTGPVGQQLAGMEAESDGRPGDASLGGVP